MAKATKNPIPPVDPEYTLTLELSRIEAEWLRTVMDAQWCSSTITLALREAGVPRLVGSNAPA